MTWRPESEADIRALIDAGDAVESHIIDFKRLVGTSDRDRKETAADMASFAIDGGSLIIGVDEPEKDRFEAMPFKTAGEVERIEQIAAQAIRPPLDVRPRVIPSDDDPELGFIVIDIRESPSRPHMVDGRYYGRGEKTRRRLDDAEVRRLMVSRQNAEAAVTDALNFQRQRFPMLGERRGILVALPLTADSDIALAFVRSGEDRLLNLLTAAEAQLPALPSYTPFVASHHELRPEGIAWTTLGDSSAPLQAGETIDSVIDIEVWENGSIRMLIPRMADQVRQWNETIEVLREASVIAWAHRLVLYAETVSAQIGYSGSWGFGVSLNGIEGLPSVTITDPGSWAGRATPWRAPGYERVTIASGIAVQEDRHDIVERLVGRFAAGLGVHDRWPGAFAPVDGPTG